MKKIINIWWKHGTKNFSITNYKKAWKENGIKPKLYAHTNGGKRKNGDRCYDASLIIGYTIFNYTNFSLQRKRA